MPLSYRIDRERALVLTEGSGVLTDEDILAHKGKLMMDPDFTPGMAQLSDVRNIERLAVTPEGVKAMVHHDVGSGVHRGGGQMALVVSTDLVFGMARMYELMGGLADRDAGQVGVFRSMEEATAWLAANPRT